MYTLLYYNDIIKEDAGVDYSDGCWKTLQPFLANDNVTSYTGFDEWLRPYHAITKQASKTKCEIIFETEEDLLVFKIKYGL
jgi:hypothetical protein